MKKIYLRIICLITIICLLIPLYAVKAFSQYYQGETLKNDLIITSEDNLVELLIPANTFSDDLAVYLTEEKNPKLPENLQLISPVYTLNFLTSQKNLTNYKLKLYYNNSDQTRAKAIFAWQNEKNWQKLYSLNAEETNVLTAETNFSSLTFAAFEILDNSVDSLSKNFISADQTLKIFVPKNWSDYDYQIKFKTFNNLDYPGDEHRLSDIYEYDVQSDQALPLTELLTIRLDYLKNDNQGKDLYYWDNNQQQWLVWPAANNVRNKYLLADFPFKFVRFAVFGNAQANEGLASWYKYKNCLCAASRDYPKGTQLKVTNLNYDSKKFNKSIIVKINDYGPESWTNNIIDLDKKAFQQLDSIKSGIINVRIEKIND